MPQHKMTIDNQPGAAFRADLNNAIAALASNSSDGIPPVTFPGQLWSDTSNGQLKIRNAANTAWVVVGLLNVDNLGFVSPGMIAWTARNTAPPGYLKANGGAVSRTAYAGLFAAIGTAYGAGDGANTFNLPDLRGEFLRGWDDGRGVDVGRVLGSLQLDALRDHVHSYQGYLALYGAAAGSSPGLYAVASPAARDTSSFGGGTETRPRNVAALACIKY